MNPMLKRCTYLAIAPAKVPERARNAPRPLRKIRCTLQEDFFAAYSRVRELPLTPQLSDLGLTLSQVERGVS